MKQPQILELEFVEFIPSQIEDGKLYVSMQYSTVVHNCCCGCGNKVVTPLTPDDWKLTYDGENISIFPSIGNWSFPCQSHYWVRRGSIEWSGKWTAKEIDAGRQLDRKMKKKRYAHSAPVAVAEPQVPEAEIQAQVPVPIRGWWGMLRQKFRAWF